MKNKQRNVLELPVSTDPRAENSARAVRIDLGSGRRVEVEELLKND